MKLAVSFRAVRLPNPNRFELECLRGSPYHCLKNFQLKDRRHLLLATPMTLGQQLTLIFHLFLQKQLYRKELLLHFLVPVLLQKQLYLKELLLHFLFPVLLQLQLYLK
jgi:hypothetical protein